MTRAEFAQRVRLNALREIADRVRFLGYSVLARQYEYEVPKAGQEFIL